VSSKNTRSKSIAKTAKKAAAARRGSKTNAKAKAGKARAARNPTVAKSRTAKNVMPKHTAHKTAKTAAKTVSKPVVKPAAKAAAATKAPQKPVAHKAAPPKAAPVKTAAVKPVAPKVEEVKKPATQRQGFKTNEFVVYPAHGVGQILAIEEQEIAGAKLELFVINFIKDKMTLRVPTAKIINVGMRKLSEPALVKKALETLKGRARVKRTMWSRRAQEYEAKINSGDIVAIAEVVRDLYRSESQPEQSYSERQLYEAALDRLSREIAAVQHVTETEAVKEIEAQLAKGPRRGVKADADAVGEAEGEAEDDDEADDDTLTEDEAA
jgi:CarD family transcriptional regulator